MFCKMLYHALTTKMIDAITNPKKTILSDAIISSPVSYKKARLPCLWKFKISAGFYLHWWWGFKTALTGIGLLRIPSTLNFRLQLTAGSIINFLYLKLASLPIYNWTSRMDNPKIHHNIAPSMRTYNCRLKIFCTVFCPMPAIKMAHAIKAKSPIVNSLFNIAI